MNIFYLHEIPSISVKHHCDKHVVKMVIEYAQLLSTAHRMLDGTQWTDASSGRRIKRWRLEDSEMDGVLYNASNINHPSEIWVRKMSHTISTCTKCFIYCVMSTHIDMVKYT